MIFPAIWRALPGPRWLKTVTLVVALAVIVWLLFQYVFPWITLTFGIQDQSVGE
jgi:uncharacterized BrkB/YihY/UPF0761 family membrane protein